MAYATIQLTNGIEIKKAPVGYSWTTLFFGCLPALIRGHWTGGAILLVLGFLFFFLANIAASFVYNNYYIKDLLNKGYTVSNMGGLTEEALKAKLGLVSLPKAD